MALITREQDKIDNRDVQPPTGSDGPIASELPSRSGLDPTSDPSLSIRPQARPSRVRAPGPGPRRPAEATEGAPGHWQSWVSSHCGRSVLRHLRVELELE